MTTCPARTTVPSQSSPMEQISAIPLIPQLLIATSSLVHCDFLPSTGGSVANGSVARDDEDAIEHSNVIKDRTRHAKPSGGYREPGDDEGLPGAEDGTSQVGQ